MRKFAFLASALLFVAALGRAEVVTTEDCLDCHTDPTTTRKVNGKDVPLAFSTNDLVKSVHAKLECTDCHVGIKELQHESKLPAAKCTGCHDTNARHEKAVDEYARSIHGVSQKLGPSKAASCADCHGSHKILPIKDADSSVFKFNLPATCARCHSNRGLTDEYRIKFPQAASQYLDSIHGRALMKMGLIVAPSCNDCHGVHDIKRSIDSGSPISRVNIAKTCGKCHVKVEEVYNRSVHGQLLAKGDRRAPVCTDCHTAHEIEPPGKNHFKATSDQRCGKCHEERLANYHDTYHGKAMALGRPNVAPDVAACYDCHGHHDVLPASHAEARLSSAKIQETCGKCHDGANANFVKYVPHANPMDRKNYPSFYYVFWFMTGLLASVFTIFGSHTALWLRRSGFHYLDDSKRFREARINAEADEEWFTRFLPFERFLHLLVVTSFLLLVITGMPLKFYDARWAKTIFDLIGGVDVARALHHFGAIVTFVYFGLHLANLVADGWRGRKKLRDPISGKFKMTRLWKVLFGPDSMMPNMDDLRDVVAHVKYFLGKGSKPQFDRWTYWEKFDYFAVFWGVAIIGFSGLVMWFPQFFTQFLPGWFINIALIVHSDEALLAAGFIFTVHFFNTHFRPERFPMDTVIFSGRISKAEMLHERKRWYDRLVAEGRLDQFRVRDEWERWKNIARSFGYLFFGLGMVLLVLIVYAMVRHLTH